MNSEAFVLLALNILQCNQKELASRLGVSSTQISKWKKGEHMSRDMEEKLRLVTGTGDKDPSFILSAGSLEAATKWEKLILFIAKIAGDNSETGYDTQPLIDENELLPAKTFRVLQEMGVSIPRSFPKELDFDYEDDEEDKFGELLEQNMYVRIIDEMFCSLNDVYGFYVAYVSKLMWDETLDLYDTDACNIEPCLLHLAASKLEADRNFATKFSAFKYDVEKNYTKWLTIVKDRAFRTGIPLRAELMDLVYGSNDQLGHDAEAESLGFNVSRLHPDVYMNELLQGMRVIHQVLPAILKKLGIEEEFKLDESELRLSQR